MKISANNKRNFQTLQDAMVAGKVIALDAQEKATGESVVLVCAVNKTEKKKKEYEFVPLAVLIQGNPFDIYNPPKQDGSQGYEGEVTKGKIDPDTTVRGVLQRIVLAHEVPGSVNGEAVLCGHFVTLAKKALGEIL